MAWRRPSRRQKKPTPSLRWRNQYSVSGLTLSTLAWVRAAIFPSSWRVRSLGTATNWFFTEYRTRKLPRLGGRLLMPAALRTMLSIWLAGPWNSRRTRKVLWNRKTLPKSPGFPP